MPGARHVKPLRIVFLGDAEVGKTSIIHQFLYGVFTERTSPTLGKSFYETIRLPSKFSIAICLEKIRHNKFNVLVKIWGGVI